MKYAIGLFALLMVSYGSAYCATDADADAAAAYSFSVVGPYGGDVKSLAVDPSNPNRLYLGTSDGQIYLSVDGALNWRRLLSFNHPGYSVDKILIDETNPKTIYAPIWFVANDSDGTIMKSTDGGESWRELKGITGHSVRALAIAPSNPRILVAAAIDAAYQSTDSGETWNRISPLNHPDIIRLHSTAIDPKDPKIIYLGTEHLPWKTEDGGNSWYSIKGHPTEKKQQFIDDSDIFSIVVDRTDPNRVLSSACSGIYQSNDGAKTWSKFQGIPFTSRRTHVIYPDPVNGQIIYSGTTEGLWKTFDGGITWRPMTSTRTIVNAIAIHQSNPQKIYLGVKYGGVLVSDDGGLRFQPFNSGFVNRQISTLLGDYKVKDRVYAGVLFNGYEGGLYISNDGGLSWQSIGRGLEGQDVYRIYQSRVDDRVLYAGTNAGLYRSKDRGENWSRVGGSKTVPVVKLTSPKGKLKVTRGPKRTIPVAIVDRVTDIAPIHSPKGGLLAASWLGLFRVDEAKGAIENIKIGDYNGRVLSVATHPANPNIFYAGTAAGIYSTTDDGKTWTHLPLADTEEPSPVVLTVAVSPRDHNVLLIGTQRSCYFSADGGRSWSRRGRGLPYGEAAAISYNGSNPDLIVVGQNRGGGLFISTNGGDVFQRIDRGLPSVRICAVTFDPFDPLRLYVGSFSSGIYLFNRGQAGSQAGLSSR